MRRGARWAASRRGKVGVKAAACGGFLTGVSAERLRAALDAAREFHDMDVELVAMAEAKPDAVHVAWHRGPKGSRVGL